MEGFDVVRDGGKGVGMVDGVGWMVSGVVEGVVGECSVAIGIIGDQDAVGRIHLRRKLGRSFARLFRDSSALHVPCCLPGPTDPSLVNARLAQSPLHIVELVVSHAVERRGCRGWEMRGVRHFFLGFDGNRRRHRVRGRCDGRLGGRGGGDAAGGRSGGRLKDVVVNVHRVGGGVGQIE